MGDTSVSVVFPFEKVNRGWNVSTMKDFNTILNNVIVRIPFSK